MKKLPNFDPQNLEACADALEHAHPTFNRQGRRGFKIEPTNDFAARFIRAYLADETTVEMRAARLHAAVRTVCEGFTLPDDARKILEKALFS
jgi:hypothetical protein